MNQLNPLVNRLVNRLFRRLVGPVIGGLVLACALVAIAFAAGPDVVQGPGADADCFKPWGKDTTFFQWKKKKGPYRIALANGFIGNTWRIQMIKTAKAYAEQPAVKAKLKEFKVISTGEDLPAQIAAANNLIDAGYDAVIVNALNPTAFAPVAKKAKAAGVVLLSFDNVIESRDNIVVNVDQVELGRLAARWLLKEVKPDGKTDGKLLEVRGPSGNSVDRDRHDGFHEVLNKSGRKFEVVEVVGKWDDGTAQKATADAIAIHKKLVGIYVQGGSTGTVHALLDARAAYREVCGHRNCARFTLARLEDAQIANARVNDMGDVCMTVPAISGGMLFVRSQHSLFALGRKPTDK
jgi:ribose transport system substrate-binding protein